MESKLNDPTLAGLYPFLAGKRQDAGQLHAALLESVRQKAAESIAVKQRFFNENAAAIVAAAQALADVYCNGGRLYTMGNGGSSCDAAHIAVEFQHPVTAGRPALPARNLGDDVAMLTAVGNDVGFKHVFVRQVIAQLRPGDALIGVSTSGNSENVLTAFTAAKARGAVTIGLAGGDGGRMRGFTDLDHCLVVPSDSIHRVQESHVALYHILWDLTHTLLADDRGSAAKES
ncbi:phosphoheptose isomerase [Sulfuriferula plumbiphila]|uniref:Phosphoheptose isomerase n=1 Tax=Sulfuriferula plumbiphila TaxID=171865 RepID=A0A512L8S0_9PROT|nr:SIS domain-containing protein [Sulfuriferula plumbiphila]BBP04284.1 phosphoheptose isomerase [Sulfuriferula plumbiphila]GEP30886.1 phosphoheptose isomerase [Sulfuriferula plumbiphila]